MSDLQGAGFTDIETFSFDLQVAYSRESWVGRIRASGPVGGTLNEDGMQACARELSAMLVERFPADPLVIPHRTWAVTARAPA